MFSAVGRSANSLGEQRSQTVTAPPRLAQAPSLFGPRFINCSDTIRYMAKTVTVVDDIDGSANAETVTFSFEGDRYEIDLAKKNRTAFEKALKPYIDAAQKVSRARSSSDRRGRRSSGPKRDLAAIRAWAAEQGYEVSERGRIAQAIVEEYDAAR